jgi:hypothetical protein
VQFQVHPELYDWFFNARTGYRAQFWISPEAGAAFNERLSRTLADTLSAKLPATLAVRRVHVDGRGTSRGERDEGAVQRTRDELLASLSPGQAKIWICERLCKSSGDPPGGVLPDIGFAALADAQRSAAKLVIPRWVQAANSNTGEQGEGLRAPLPCPNDCWLDFKGGFLDAQGRASQIKPQVERAQQIHKCGWT